MDCCTWDGVTCDLLTGHVIGLDLSCSLLNGIIYANSSLFQLRHLQTLNLAKIYFYPELKLEDKLIIVVRIAKENKEIDSAARGI